MKKLLIFDAYGTLLSTGTGSLDATEKILALQDKAINATEFYAEWKKLHREHLDESNAGEFLSEAEIFAKDLKCLYEQFEIDRPYEQDVQIMLDSLTGRSAFSEVLEAIANLRQSYHVVIGSTTDTEPLLENLRANHLEVDEVYTSEMIEKYKPARAFYEYILAYENCTPEKAVFIGDSLIDDVEGPQSVGITTVLVDRKKKYDASSVKTAKPDYVVKSIAEIVKLDFL